MGMSAGSEFGWKLARRLLEFNSNALFESQQFPQPATLEASSNSFVVLIETKIMKTE